MPQHVGDLLAIIWAGPAPADHDPLADVGAVSRTSSR
jgi:hypothetical protein